MKIGPRIKVTIVSLISKMCCHRAIGENETVSFGKNCCDRKNNYTFVKQK